MKTKAEIIASLPERFKDMDFEGFEPFTDLDEANIACAHAGCVYRELLHAFKTLIEKYS